MISVGSRDEKKLSLVYGFKGEKMELENEIEEGEALFQNNHNNYGHNYDDDDDDDDSRIDPDVSLSYIDEKIQDVLGDCQKEFEGGVSAENLGAKYGGYGSFLPTYQRSPVCSHPKTPQKVATYSVPVSPNNAHIEVGHQNPISQSSASQPPRNGPKSKSNNKSKQEARSSSGEKSKSATDSDPKSLKVRLKVGSDNLSIKKKAEILSGLGLDVSPSSSLEASPVDSNGFFHTGQNGPDESPTSILEMMTSFPISGNLLLSPLPYDVLHLTEKKLEDGSCGPAHKGSQESTLTALHGSDLVKVDQNALQEKSKSNEKNSASMESTNGDDIHNTIDVKPNKETSVDRLTVGNKTSSSSGIKNESFSSKNKNKSKGSKGYNVKVKETYKDFFGELDLDHEDHDFEKPSEGNNVKSTPEFNLLKERLNGKKSQQLSSSTMGNGVLSDAVVPMAVPVVNEDWVCCDKCEKWRLLPPGVNPGSLPEKWLCSMLDWLPGMNSCSISEEETTKAITTRFPGPSVPSGPHITATSLNGTHQQHLGSSQFPSSNIKKKHGLKDLPNSEVKQERPSTSSNSSKKNLHKSYKTRSLNDANNSPFINEVEFQDSGHSRDVIVEKEKLKQKENNNKLCENIADGGVKTHHPKINNKRECIQDFYYDRKKIKIDDKNGGKIDKKDVLKKRKSVNEIDGNTNKYTKEKKPRVIKSFDKDIPATKHKNIEDVKLVDSSSSSKVSGSHKTRNINQETKGSPVESVSSSPMRILNVKPVDQPLTKNTSTRINEEKSKRHKSQGKVAKGSISKELSLHKKVKIDAISSQDSKKPVKKDASIKGKSTSLPPKGQIEIENKENGGNNMQLKELKPNKKSQSQNGSQPLNIKDSSVNKQKAKIPDSTGVVLVRDLSNQATTNALREATNLKHMADRVKNGGSSLESRALYLQAALKFLHVASLFESCHSQTGRYGDMIQSLSIYSSTAKLCEYCAHEYERTKEMSTTSLAYKCMEVAYMKVIYSSHSTNCKDVNELQTSLPTGPTGESPSSSASASDLDNLTKGVNASQVAGNHVIPAKNKPNFTRILNFAQDVNSAMEASRRSRTAFAASNSKDETVKSAIKKALDFNFHDVEGFLHLVRIAMEVINR